MTICNMTIEGGGRAGMIAPDETTFAWVRDHGGDGRRRTGRELYTDEGATFDKEITVDVDAISPQVTWGTNPEMVVGVADCGAGAARTTATSARCTTWASKPGRRCRRSSSTASSSARARTRASATCARPRRSSKGRKVAVDVNAMVVPGSAQVKAQAEEEGLDEVFRAAGFDWRGAGCSMCLGMNPDIAAPGERVRLDQQPQLRGPPGQGRPHAPRLARMAAAAAIEGHFVDIRTWES